MIPLIIALSIATVALYIIAAKRGKTIELLEASTESWQTISTAQTKEILALERENENLAEQLKQDDSYITAHRRVIDAREQEIEILKLKLQNEISSNHLIKTIAKGITVISDMPNISHLKVKKRNPDFIGNASRKKLEKKNWTHKQKQEFIDGFKPINKKLKS